MKPFIKSLKFPFSAAVVLTLIGIPLYFGGLIGGCGSNDDTSTDDDVNVSSVSDVPSLNISDYYDSTGASANTSAGVSSLLGFAGEEGGFCTEFCYLKQCLMETLRHSQEAELIMCVTKKGRAANPEFDFTDDSQFHYFNVTPPAWLAEGENDLVRVRMKQAGSTFTFQMCEPNESGVLALAQELIITDTSEGITGTLTRKFVHRDPEGRSKEDNSQGTVTINGTCTDPKSPDCVASFSNTINGLFGRGSINFNTTKNGDGFKNYTLGASFAMTCPECGSSELGVYADWTSPGIGCFKANDVGGTFPAIPATEVELPPLGCGADVQAAAFYCPNSNFDGEDFDVNFPVCPFIPAIAGATCPIDRNNEINCCRISGNSIADQSGVVVSTSTDEAVYNRVNTGTYPTLTSTVTFQIEWDCAMDNPADIDLTAGGIDWSDCQAIKDSLEAVNQDGGASCQENEIRQDGEKLGDGDGCTNDDQCPGTEVCVTPEGGGGKTFCAPPRTTCNVDSDCPAGDVCEFDFEDNANFCVKDFSCTDDSQCPPNVSCVDNECDFPDPGCNANADCTAKFGGGNCVNNMCQPPSP